MDAALEPAILAMTDAMVAASGWSERLYPDNGWLAEDEQLSMVVLTALGDGAEPFPAERLVGGTHVVVYATGRVLALAPDVSQATADAALRAAAPTQGVCDYCPEPLLGSAVLLPYPAGATVVAVSLCAACVAFLRSTFPTAHYVTCGG
ncbi:MAG: hypothetical protein QOI54_3187 [Actinomycetota bacterium]|jgi:hypothetical protein|nr:hypothetical protein [Actinomycetota bacterium]